MCGRCGKVKQTKHMAIWTIDLSGHYGDEEGEAEGETEKKENTGSS